MQLAAKNAFGFEPKMDVDPTTAGTTETPQPLRPTLGAVANLRYKPATWQYCLRLSAAPSAGQATVRLRAGGTEVRAVSFDLSGNTLVGDSIPVDLSEVQGQAELVTELEITTATGGSETATLDSWLYVEQPLTISGC